ncbi:MAG: response regulator transcription factor [Polyangiales bacterium]|nr:response regulator transcription factor [Sandaracinus sp.]
MKPRVLVVDDDDAFRDASALVLAQAGCEPATAGRISDARRLLTGEPFDVLLLDIHLGTESGLDLLDHLHEMDRSTRAILVTAQPSLGTAIVGVRHCVVDYLIKPVVPEELLDSVWVATERARALDRLGQLRARADDLVDALTELRPLKASTRPPSRPEEPPPESPLLERLTVREQEVVARVARAATVREIAAELAISEHTVRNHLRAIYTKLEVHSRVELVHLLFSQRDDAAR